MKLREPWKEPRGGTAEQRALWAGWHALFVERSLLDRLPVGLLEVAHALPRRYRRSRPNFPGIYVHASDRASLVSAGGARIDSREDGTVEIRLAVDVDDEELALMFAHELGHAIDWTRRSRSYASRASWEEFARDAADCLIFGLDVDTILRLL